MDERGAALRLRGRLRSRARDRQRAACVACGRPRFRRLVQLQILERRTRRGRRRFVHRRCAEASTCRASQAGGATTSRAASTMPREFAATSGRARLAAQQPADPVTRAARLLARAVSRGRHDATAPQIGTPDGLPRAAARSSSSASAIAILTPSEPRAAAASCPCRSAPTRAIRARCSHACAARACRRRARAERAAARPGASLQPLRRRNAAVRALAAILREE